MNGEYDRHGPRTWIGMGKEESIGIGSTRTNESVESCSCMYCVPICVFSSSRVNLFIDPLQLRDRFVKRSNQYCRYITYFTPRLSIIPLLLHFQPFFSQLYLADASNDDVNIRAIEKSSIDQSYILTLSVSSANFLVRESAATKRA
jgi:hypothetical protein